MDSRYIGHLIVVRQLVGKSNTQIQVEFSLIKQAIRILDRRTTRFRNVENAGLADVYAHRLRHN